MLRLYQMLPTRRVHKGHLERHNHILTPWDGGAGLSQAGAFNADPSGIIDTVEVAGDEDEPLPEDDPDS